jgi:valyl-tRNA synthetase|tara:strand:+ start:7808 stop:10126 length:2319 start_codon:yes stop_codon:yes gene_type:complete
MESKIQEKNWSVEIEKNISKIWEKESLYDFNIDDQREIFTIDTPPPYPSGRPWHIGAAAHYSQIDMIARTARMMNYNVLFPIGIDRNGLPVEIYTEKKFKISMISTPREKFTDLCKIALDDLEAEMITTMKRMGLSGLFKQYYRTDSDEYRALTQSTFIELWKKGEVYQSSRPNNYCPKCRTTIADAEIFYQEIPSKLVYLKFYLKQQDEYVLIATTRPELLSSCQVVLVNPEDERFKKLWNKEIRVPVFNNLVKIVKHPSAKMEFGSGAVMICSYGDYTDVLLFRELKLQEKISIDVKGRMTENAEKYQGLKVNEAREKIIKDLQELDLVDRIENINHRTPCCERSKNPMEIIPMEEYYLKQLDHKNELLEIAKKLEFHPEEHRRRLIDWIEAISIDWPISRRRYNATEVPVWYCKQCNEPNLPEPGKYYRPWKEKPPFDTCKKCGNKEFIGDKRTFDTWMDSSISPLFITKYQKDNEFHKKSYPTKLRPQSKDIIRTWLHYTILRCNQLTEKTPFTHAWIMGYGVDERGEKMSKSKGNAIDPIPILERNGADMFRLWAASEVNLGSDFRVSEIKITGVGKFLSKLWNISKFISSFPVVEEEPLETDKWILSELSTVIDESLDGYSDYNFFVPANKVREFIWNIFAPHYIELVKQRAYGIDFDEKSKRAAWSTLHICLKNSLLLLAPIVPFITDKIWREVYSDQSIHKQIFQKNEFKYEFKESTEKIIEFNSLIWNKKKQMGISLKNEISENVPKELKVFKKDLEAMHKLR